MNFWNKIESVCAELSPNCREAVRAQSEALDHPLPASKRFGLWAHLLICQWCRRYGQQVRFLAEAAREREETLVAGEPQALSRGARERIKERLRSQAQGH
jgi:hypothetical protein